MSQHNTERWATEKAATPDRKARKQVLPAKRTSKTVLPKAVRKGTAAAKNGAGKTVPQRRPVVPPPKPSAKQPRKAAPESQVALSTLETVLEGTADVCPGLEFMSALTLSVPIK